MLPNPPSAVTVLFTDQYRRVMVHLSRSSSFILKSMPATSKARMAVFLPARVLVVRFGEQRASQAEA